MSVPPAGDLTVGSSVTSEGVQLQVTDDGPGIEAQALPRIFDKFVKGAEPGASIADGSQGTGLGLAIAKGLMEAHGGTIDVESPVRDGGGARFIFIFPREETPWLFWNSESACALISAMGPTNQNPRIQVTCPACVRSFTEHHSKIRASQTIKCLGCHGDIVFENTSQHSSVKKALSAARHYRLSTQG